jgi:dipeptidyl-peptidase-4
MSTPQANPEGYRKSSVLSVADQLRDNLLLIHGTADDNVHMQHSLQLAGT